MATLLWTQRQDIGPSARFGHALAYDQSKECVLLVGGDGLGSLYRDTWLWNGENWTQVENIGPAGRAEHAVAYDSARARVVLFGGRGSQGVLADTWEWDGEAWTQVEDTGPSARSGHALAYDAVRSRVVLFGGTAGGGPLGDTWEWDGDEWTQVADTGPSARAGHAMCFYSPQQATLLFGGSGGSDTWAWSGTSWTNLNDVGPAPCDGSGLVSVANSAVLFGGVDGTTNPATLFRITWEFDGSDWTERQDIGPGPRYGHAMAYDSARDRVTLFGGSGAGPAAAISSDLFADTWELPVDALDSGGPGSSASAPRLSSFTITPGDVAVGEPFTIAVAIDRPATAPVQIEIVIDTGGRLAFLAIDTGQTSVEYTHPSEQFPLAPRSYEMYAVLGQAEALTATLDVLE